MKQVEVYIPSLGRAKTLTTRRFFPDAQIVVSPEEADEYRDIWDEPLMVLPTGVQGNLSRVRNYILDNATSDWILTVEDDHYGFGYFEGDKEHKLDGKQLEDFVLNSFIMAEDLGTGLWGLNPQKDPKFYHMMTPFSFKSIILGPWMAVI